MVINKYIHLRNFIFTCLMNILLITSACTSQATSINSTSTLTDTRVPPGETANFRPTDTVVIPPATPSPLPSPVLEQWDLLIISDSSNWGVGEQYARLIEADMNVKVNLHDCWKGNLPVLRTLQTLQKGGTWSSYVGDKSCNKPLIDLVKEAEVMVLFGNPMGADAPSGSQICIIGGFQGKNQLPGFEAYKETLLTSCSPENWSTYKTNLGLLIDEIFNKREGTPLILRMTNFYITSHSVWVQYDVNEVCTTCLGSFSEAIRQVAAEKGVPIADTMLALSGEDYMLEPVKAGYIRTDGEHLTDAGAQFVASLLQQTGYEYAGK